MSTLVSRPITVLAALVVALAVASSSTAVAQETEPPAKPTGLDGAIAHDRVTLTWDDPGDDSITGYQIRRRHATGNNHGDFKTHVDNTGNADTTYVDTDVESGQRYVYRVKAWNASGLSARSGYFNARVPHPPR